MDTINYQKPKIKSRFIKYTEVRRKDNTIPTYQTQHLHQNKGAVRNIKIGRTPSNNEEARFPVYGVETGPKNKDEFDLSEITIQFEDEVQTLYVGPVEIKENTIASVQQSSTTTTQRTETVIISPKVQVKQEIVQNIPKSHGIPARVIQKSPKQPTPNKNRGFVDSLQQAQKCVPLVLAASTASVSISPTQSKAILTDRNSVQQKKTAQQKLDCVSNVIHGTSTTNTTAQRNVNTNPMKNDGVRSEINKKVTGLSHITLVQKSVAPGISIAQKQAKTTQNHKKPDKPDSKIVKRFTQTTKSKQSVINQHFVKIEKGGAALLLQDDKDYKTPSPANSDSGIENCVEELDIITNNVNCVSVPKIIPEFFKKLNLCPTPLHPALSAKHKASQHEVLETIIVDPVVEATEKPKEVSEKQVIVETIVVDPEPQVKKLEEKKEEQVKAKLTVEKSLKKKRGRPSRKEKPTKPNKELKFKVKPPSKRSSPVEKVLDIPESTPLIALETSITEDTPVVTDFDESLHVETVQAVNISENILIIEPPVEPEKDTSTKDTEVAETIVDIPETTPTEATNEGDDVLIEIVLKDDNLNTSGSNFKPVEYLCPKCPKKMAFKNEVWYKKHLVNFHGVDLTNIAQFLSNLQQNGGEIADTNVISENAATNVAVEEVPQDTETEVSIQEDTVIVTEVIEAPPIKSGKNLDVKTKAIKNEKSEKKRRFSVSTKNSDDSEGKPRKKNKVSLILFSNLKYFQKM